MQGHPYNIVFTNNLEMDGWRLFSENGPNWGKLLSPSYQLMDMEHILEPWSVYFEKYDMYLLSASAKLV